MIKRSTARSTTKAPSMPRGAVQKGSPSWQVPVPTTTLPTAQIENLVRKCVEAGKKYDEAMLQLQAERNAKQDLEAQLQQRESHDVHYLESTLQATEQELHELEAKDKTQTALLALYQSKLKNVSDMFRFYELTDSEAKIKISQLQRDVESMEALVADQKLSIETIEKSSIRTSALLQQEQHSKQELHNRIELLQQQLLDRRQDMANLEATARQQDELLSVKDQAYARLEERYTKLQDDFAALRVKATAPVNNPPPPPTVVAQTSAAAANTSQATSGTSEVTVRPSRGTALEMTPTTDISAAATSAQGRNPAPQLAPAKAHAGSAIIYSAEEESAPGAAHDVSYGAMFGSADNSLAQDISFQSSITTARSRVGSNVLTQSVDNSIAFGHLAASRSLDGRQADAGAVDGHESRRTEAGESSIEPGIATACLRGTASDPAWRSALDPTPMKRKAPRRTAEAIAVASPSTGDPLHSVLQGDSAEAQPVPGPTEQKQLKSALRKKAAPVLPLPQPSAEPDATNTSADHKPTGKPKRYKVSTVSSQQEVPLEVKAKSAVRKTVKRTDGANTSTDIVHRPESRRHRTFDATVDVSRSGSSREGHEKARMPAGRPTQLSSSTDFLKVSTQRPTIRSSVKPTKVATSQLRGASSTSGVAIGESLRPMPPQVEFSESLFGLLDL
jgi:hypothetical protein